MAATVGMTIITKNNVTNEEQELNLNYVNPKLFDTSDTSVLMTSYQRADTVARAIVAFSENTYVDALINRSVSVGNELAG